MEHQNAAIPDEEGGVASGDQADALLSSDGCGQYMTTTSLHSFGEFDGAGNGFTIQIIENMREEYGMFVWPCSVVLAEYIWQQRLRFAGISVVELGAGTSLPGLVAAKVGANVTLTDDLDRPEVLDNIGRACDLNKLNCEVIFSLLALNYKVLSNFFGAKLDVKVVGLTWGVWDEHVIGLSPQIILGADVLYDTYAFEDLFSTVAFLLESCPGSVFITTYHNRSGHHLIELLLVKWGLKVVKLVDGFSFLPSYKASGFSGNIQLAEIVLNSHLVMNSMMSP